MWKSVYSSLNNFCYHVGTLLLYLADVCFGFIFRQEQLECTKRGWELQQLQKLKEEEEERQFMEGDEDLFTYTREDAYNMVGRHCDLY